MTRFKVFDKKIQSNFFKTLWMAYPSFILNLYLNIVHIKMWLIDFETCKTYQNSYILRRARFIRNPVINDLCFLLWHPDNMELYHSVTIHLLLINIVRREINSTAYVRRWDLCPQVIPRIDVYIVVGGGNIIFIKNGLKIILFSMYVIDS